MLLSVGTIYTMLRGVEKSGWWLAALLVALLVLLGWLQYQWLGALSKAERARMASSLVSGVEAVGVDLDRLLTELALAFVGTSGATREAPAVVLNRWRDRSPVPSLVKAVWRLEPRRGQRMASYRLDEQTGTFVEASLPPSFAAWAERERSRHRRGRTAGAGVEGTTGADADDPGRNGLDQEPTAPDEERRAARRRGPGQRGERQSAARSGDGLAQSRRSYGLLHPGLREQPLALVLPTIPDEPSRLLSRLRAASILVVELDEATLFEKVVPELMVRHLSTLTATMPWVRVVQAATGDVLYDTGTTASARKPDADAAFLRLLPVDRLGSRSVLAASPQDEGRGLADERSRKLPRWDRLAAGDRPRWRLEVTHPSGSLEAQVRVARRRNLSVASAVLAVLAASVVMLVASARRAQALARQRLEMVAAVTHELRTPLAAVCSAGSNLADGVVSEPEGVKRYGEVILEEGQRLARLVEQTLAYAGTVAGSATGGRPSRDADVGDAQGGDALAGGAVVTRPTAVAPWVTDVVGRRQAELDAAGMAVQLDLDPSLPSVEIDQEAMTRVLDNLVMNAIRHAAEGGSLDVAAIHRPGQGRRVRAIGARRRGVVELSVADRGPGLTASDRRQVFEPFYRGRRARERSKGTGLGLAVVRAVAEAHGGGVSVAAREGGGSVFTVRLPVASPSHSAAAHVDVDDVGRTSEQPPSEWPARGVSS